MYGGNYIDNQTKGNLEPSPPKCNVSVCFMMVPENLLALLGEKDYQAFYARNLIALPPRVQAVFAKPDLLLLPSTPPKNETRKINGLLERNFEEINLNSVDEILFTPSIQLSDVLMTIYNCHTTYHLYKFTGNALTILLDYAQIQENLLHQGVNNVNLQSLNGKHIG